MFSCSGIAISRKPDHHLTRILTSASLARALDGERKKHYCDLKVGADIHPLLFFFASDHYVIISCLIIVCRLKCVMKARKHTGVLWRNMI